MPRFCHSCGAALAEPGAFCSACGTPAAKEEAPPAKSPWRSTIQQFFTPVRPSRPVALLDELSHLGRFVILGIVLLILFIIWASSREANQAPARSSDAPIAVEGPKAHRIGEDFAVGYWSYRCNGATWQSMIPSLGTLETPDAAFLVVDLYVRNNDRTASTLPPLKLVDAQGREYDESSKRTFMPGAFDMLKELNPGVSSRGYAVFDAPRGQYTLQVSGGFESGEHALVDLSPPESSDRATSKPSSTHAQPTNAETPTQTDKTEENTEGARTSPSPSATTQSPQLQFEAGARVFVHVVSISRQPDGGFTFRGTLLQPIALAGAASLDQGTELAGTGTVNGGHVTVLVTGFTVRGENYRLQAASGANKRAGSGPAIELDPGKVLEMWFASASVYGKSE